MPWRMTLQHRRGKSPLAIESIDDRYYRPPRDAVARNATSCICRYCRCQPWTHRGCARPRARRNCSLTLLSVARVRSRRVLVLIRTCPRLLFLQVSVKQDVEGLLFRLRGSSFVPPNRPKSIRRVLSGLSTARTPRPGRPGVCLALEADGDVVCIPHEDHVARGLVSSPRRGQRSSNAPK